MSDKITGKSYMAREDGNQFVNLHSMTTSGNVVLHIGTANAQALVRIDLETATALRDALDLAIPDIRHNFEQEQLA